MACQVQFIEVFAHDTITSKQARRSIIITIFAQTPIAHVVGNLIVGAVLTEHRVGRDLVVFALRTTRVTIYAVYQYVVIQWWRAILVCFKSARN